MKLVPAKPLGDYEDEIREMYTSSRTEMFGKHIF